MTISSRLWRHRLQKLPNIPLYTFHTRITITSPLKFTEYPLNLKHPILSKLDQACLNITQFNQIHGLIITTGMFHNTFAASRLVITSSFNLDPPNIPLAHLLFAQIKFPDVYSYNIMIKASTQASDPTNVSFPMYQKMLLQGLLPNEYTFCFIFTSCAHVMALMEGQQVHSHLVKHGLHLGVFASTSLVHMYSECGDLEKAVQAFDEMCHRSDVSWGVIIDAYISLGFYDDGFRLFAEMRVSGVEASNGTLVSVLGACAKVQKLVFGRLVHGYVVCKGLELNVTLGTSLVDMYSKCGAIEMARVVFSMIQLTSVASWNCMINGLAMNGHGVEAITMFEEMQALGLRPNAATLVGVLNSCSHAGLVGHGLSFFARMNEIYRITPNVKHFGCMVDLYGRAGKFTEALEVIRTMPMNPDIVIWVALLGACRIHGRANLGELIGAQIMKLQPYNITGCKNLSDMYAMAGCWGDVIGVRRMMLDMDIAREPGLSCITN